MSPLPPGAPDPTKEAFPTLTAAQIERIRPLGRVRSVEAGEILFEPARRNIGFFVLLSAEMEVVQPSLEGERRLAIHVAGGFTGEMTMISGQQSLARGRITKAGEVLELDAEALRSLVARDAELSEILLGAFLMRRSALIRAGYGNIILLGSRHSARTLELREFLTRNGHPYTYSDLDTDKESQELLDRFHVQPS